MSFEPFTTLTSKTAVLPQANIDTDQIIPARFLTTTSKEGLGEAAFHDWRFDAAGRPDPSFPLTGVDPAAHRILVAGENFGCGSSREHAPWALLAFGFRAVVSSAIADIFTSNALGNGLLPVTVDRETHAALLAAPGMRVTIDLRAERLDHEGGTASFAIPAFDRRCLLEGRDRLDMLLGALPATEAFEAENGR